MLKLLGIGRRSRPKYWQSTFVISPREPRPHDPRRRSLLDLPDELVLLVCHYLQDVSPQSVIALASVSSSLYGKARYVQHRDVSIDLAKIRDEVRYLEYLSYRNLLPAIRTIRFNDFGKRPPRGEDLYIPPNELFAQMTGLCEVYWEGLYCAIPALFVRYLKRRQRVRLLGSVINFDKQFALRYISSLRGSLNLYSLSVDVEYVTVQDCLGIMPPLKGLLLSCPELRKLSLDIHLPRLGCPWYDRPPGYCGLGFVDGEKLPRLEEFAIIDYPWGHRSPNSALFPIHGPDVKRVSSRDLEQRYWADNFDWSGVRRLTAHDASFASKIAHKLTAVREVNICPDAKPRLPPVYDAQAAIRFFHDVSATLESITVPKPCINTAAITRHGSRLKKLALIRRDLHQNWIGNSTSKEFLAQLRDGLPLLEELDISVVKYRDEWPDDILDILASFPRLRRLKLSVQLPQPEDEDEEPVRPYLTMKTAERLFHYLREQSPNECPPLQRLHICSKCAGVCGDWSEANSTEFLVHSVVDDGSGHPEVEVMCTKLNDELNAKMRRVVRGEEARSAAELSKVDFKVALDGPVSKSQLRTMRVTYPLPFTLRRP